MRSARREAEWLSFPTTWTTVTSGGEALEILDEIRPAARIVNLETSITAKR